MKHVIEDFLVVLSPKDAYVLYREIVKRFEILKAKKIKMSNSNNNRGPLYLQEIEGAHMVVSHLELEYNTDSKTSLNVQSDRFS